MSSPVELEPHGTVAWLRLLAGTLVWLLPGIAAADRWMPGRWRWAWALPLGFSLMALAGILLDFALAWPLRTIPTAGLAVTLGAAIGWPRLGAVARGLWRRIRPSPQAARRPRSSIAEPRVGRGEVAWLLVAVVTVGGMAALPHLPGPSPESMLEAPGLLTQRLAGGRSAVDPYPLHVDEHYHFAQVAARLRTGETFPNEPYTDAPPDTPFLSIAGLRSEFGFYVGLTQLALLSGAPLPFLFLVLPALGSMYLALATWLTLRPAPGALVASGLVAIVHTTVRFLGPAFLVPSAFGLPWLLAILVAVTKGRGPARLASLAILVPGAFVMHTVDGVLALVVGLVAAGLAPTPMFRRVALMAGILVPLVWIGPALAADAVAAVRSEHTLPFETGFFRVPGWGVLALAAVGAGVAVRTRDQRACTLALLAGGVLASLAASVAFEHANEATYARLVHVFFVALAALAGLALGAIGKACLDRFQTWRPNAGPARAMPALGAMAVTILLLPATSAHLAEPYYRIHSDATWAAAHALVADGAGPEHVFLADPLQGPLYNGVTGARPWALFYPGVPSPRGADVEHYLSSGGADVAWLRQRGIDYVVGLGPPNAPFSDLGHGVYRLAP